MLILVLSTQSLNERINNGEKIINNTVPENFGKFNYDLRIEKIIKINEEDNNEQIEKYDLPAGGTVFVSTVETLDMPSDLIGIVTQKNSVMRLGLSVDAPIYHPGHKTRMFLRITNISSSDIKISKDEQIASIMFAKIDSEVGPCNGQFVDEFSYIGVGNFTNNIPQSVKISKKMETTENAENRIYSKVVSLLTIFIGIFSLINLNIQFLGEKNIVSMIAYNLISISGISILVSFIGLTLNSKKSIESWIFLALSIVMIVTAIFII